MCHRGSIPTFQHCASCSLQARLVPNAFTASEFDHPGLLSAQRDSAQRPCVPRFDQAENSMVREFNKHSSASTASTASEVDCHRGNRGPWQGAQRLTHRGLIAISIRFVSSFRAPSSTPAAASGEAWSPLSPKFLPTALGAQRLTASYLITRLLAETAANTPEEVPNAHGIRGSTARPPILYPLNSSCPTPERHQRSDHPSTEL